MRALWSQNAFDEDGNPLMPSGLDALLLQYLPAIRKTINVLGMILLFLCSFGAGWLGHTLFNQPDYSEVIAELKKEGYNNLALTMEEHPQICPKGPKRQKRACHLLLTAPDILAKTPVEDDGQKVAINIPEEKP